MQISIGTAAHLALKGQRCDPLTDAIKSAIGSERMRDPSYSPTQADIDAIGVALDVAWREMNEEGPKQIGAVQWHGGVFTLQDFHDLQNQFLAARDAIKEVAHLVGLYRPASHQVDWPA